MPGDNCTSCSLASQPLERARQLFYGLPKAMCQATCQATLGILAGCTPPAPTAVVGRNRCAFCAYAHLGALGGSAWHAPAHTHTSAGSLVSTLRFHCRSFPKDRSWRLASTLLAFWLLVSTLPFHCRSFPQKRVGGTRAKPLQSGRRPRARSLAGGLRLVTEGYIRSPPLPPTLLLDRGDTPARPPVDPRSTPAQIRSTDLYVSCAGCSKNVQKHRFLQRFVAFGGYDFRLTGRRWCRLCVPRGQA